MDLSKTFDEVPHDRLIQKVKMHKIISVVTKVKDMKNCGTIVENMQGQFKINKEVVLGHLESIKVDKSPVTDWIYPS